MKRNLTYNFLLILLISILGNNASAQEVHGYRLLLVNELSDHKFIITSRGFLGDSQTVYCIHMETSDFYDDDLTRLTITTTLEGYSDVKRIRPWERTYTGSETTYRINDTELEVSIYDRGTDYDGMPQGCRVSIYESINPNWVKKSGSSKRKST